MSLKIFLKLLILNSLYGYATVYLLIDLGLNG